MEIGSSRRPTGHDGSALEEVIVDDNGNNERLQLLLSEKSKGDGGEVGQKEEELAGHREPGAA